MIRADQGFSLVEVMIVVAMLAVLGVGATLAIGQRERAARTDVALIRDIIAQVRTEAVVARQPRQMRFDAATVSVWRPGPGNTWALGQNHSLSSSLDPEPGYGAILDGAGAMRVTFLPDRRSSAFAVRLDTGQGVWRCATDGWSPLECEEAS